MNSTNYIVDGSIRIHFSMFILLVTNKDQFISAYYIGTVHALFISHLFIAFRIFDCVMDFDQSTVTSSFMQIELALYFEDDQEDFTDILTEISQGQSRVYLVYAR